MTIDRFLDTDDLCLDGEHAIAISKIISGQYRTGKDWARKRAIVLSRPYPRALKEGVMDNLQFYLNKDVLRLKYNLAMYTLEEKSPRLYNALTSIGLPKPY